MFGLKLSKRAHRDLRSHDHVDVRPGMLLVKHLVMLNPDEGVAVKDLKLRPIPFVPADKPLYDLC